MSETPEKQDLKSIDIGEKNKTKLKALFPAVFTETVNDKGELVESIDFEKLKAELGTFSDLFEARRERYGMDWPGKKDCMRLIQQPTVATLKPCREESVNFDETENLFIEGDNLEVLKLLQKSYYGKVKMIYIDPPYNTGKEFIYPDKYSETLDTYLAYAGLADDEGRKFATNTPNEGRFHTKWLNMMYPRLYLARNLLREDGVIFISIDDTEVSNLRKLCDEFFGEENFSATIIWKKMDSPSRNDADRPISNFHDYILVYCKNAATRCLKQMSKKEILDAYPLTLPDGRPARRRQLRKNGKNARREDRPTLWYPLKAPDGTVVFPLAPEGWEGRWVLSEDTWEERERQGLTEWIKRDYGWVPYYIEVASENPSTPWSTIWDNVDQNRQAKAKFNSLMEGSGATFENPKPTNLLQQIITASTDNDSLIIDFFSGSSATAHAVINQNQIDGGNRKFILVQLPERCNENSDSFKAGYKTIADIGKERIRRVIKKIKEERTAKQKEAEGKLPGMEEEQPDLDLGFKVLKLDRSNFKVWDGTDPNASEEQIVKQLDLFVEHINPKSSQEDILYELLLKSGFMPTEKIEKLTLAGKTVFSIAEGALLICLEDEISPELIDAVAKAEPMRFICLDKGFKGNDQLKANAVQTFAARNQGREKAEQIVFRTV